MEPDVLTFVDPIRAHLESKTDTERFVGLKLLIGLFEKYPEVRKNKQQVGSIWQSIPPKFLDRLLKTACNPKAKDAQECLTLAVSVMHAFSLLVDEAGKDEKFTGRIPKLVPTLVNSSSETTELTLQLLLSLTREPQGAKELIQVEDLSPLTEAAPFHRLPLDVLRYAWLSSMHGGTFTREDSDKINEIVKNLVVSFSGTDATTLLNFMGDFLREADSASLPLTAPPWVAKAAGYIHNLCSKRPAPEAREAYTNAADSLLKTWPVEAAALLFSSKKQDDKATEHLFITLILVDIRASLPVLLEQRTSPSYEGHAMRVSRAYDIVSQFIGFLMKLSDSEDEILSVMSFDHLMSLRKSISETMDCSIEYLTDRDIADGDAKRDFQDPLSLAALRAVSLWIRENDDDKLRSNAASLLNVVTESYQISPYHDDSMPQLDFRAPCLIVLQAITEDSNGAGQFSERNGWDMLIRDLISIGEAFISNAPHDKSRWRDLIQVLDQTKSKVDGLFDRHSPQLETVALEFSKSLRSGEASIPEDDEVREYEIAVCRLVCDVLGSVCESEQTFPDSMSETTAGIRKVAGDLYKQTVVIDEDTPKYSVLKEDTEAVVADLAKLTNIGQPI